MTGKWLSKAAVLWVLDEAPDVPASLVSTLLALARYAGTDGRGAHPSATTIAAHTRKSESQAKRDLAALEERKLIERGNQLTVAYIRADRRPTVYDLAMPRGSTHDTPQDGHGVAPMHGRGSTGALHGVAPVLPEEVLKTSGNGAHGRARAQPETPDKTHHLAPGCPECGQPFSQERLADPDFRAMALRGQVLCGRPECDKADERRFIAGGSIQELLELGYYDEAVARDPFMVDVILRENQP